MLNMRGAANGGTYFVMSLAYDQMIPARVGSVVDVRQQHAPNCMCARAVSGGA